MLGMPPPVRGVIALDDRAVEVQRAAVVRDAAAGGVGKDAPPLTVSEFRVSVAAGRDVEDAEVLRRVRVAPDGGVAAGDGHVPGDLRKPVVRIVRRGQGVGAVGREGDAAAAGVGLVDRVHQRGDVVAPHMGPPGGTGRSGRQDRKGQPHTDRGDHGTGPQNDLHRYDSLDAGRVKRHITGASGRWSTGMMR